MSAPVPLHPRDIQITRIGLLAAANVVMAICLIALALAVAAGDPDTGEPAGAEIAKPDAATPYHNGAMERRR
jgi:hypothetical protein